MDTPAVDVLVTLLDVEPPVWRRLRLPGQWHLGRVHHALQRAFGWEDSHLHEFEVDGRRYARPDADLEEAELDEAEVTVYEALPVVGARLRYTYDFGDAWVHDVVVESFAEPVPAASCLAGRRACPPDDSGGPWGYAEMLAAVADPSHPEHGHYAEWLGQFDPEAFDLASADLRLRALR